MPAYTSPRCPSWHPAPEGHPEPATHIRCSFAAGHPPDRHAAAGITWTDREGRDLLADIRNQQ